MNVDTMSPGRDSDTLRIERHRAAVRFAVRGDLRFISHQDMLRLWARASARAGLPVRFSQGMNPRARLSLPLPRPVGIASEDEWLLIELTEKIEPAELCRRLQQQAPRDLAVLEARQVAPGERWQPAAAVYWLALPAEDSDPAIWQNRIQECLRRDHLPVRRQLDGAGRVKELDIRPLIRRIELVGDRMEIELTSGSGGSARPAEVLQALGVDPSTALHDLVRQQIVWATTDSPAE